LEWYYLKKCCFFFGKKFSCKFLEILKEKFKMASNSVNQPAPPAPAAPGNAPQPNLAPAAPSNINNNPQPSNQGNRSNSPPPSTTSGLNSDGSTPVAENWCYTQVK
jgi:hypothetical protein